MEDFGFTINTLLCVTVIVCKIFALHNLDWVSYKQNKLHTGENIQSINLLITRHIITNTIVFKLCAFCVFTAHRTTTEKFFT
jgi:hypothetical protein